MDQSGRLHYMEFLAATVEARGFIEEERLEEAFERLDVDGSGYITREDLQAVLGPGYDDKFISAMMEEGNQDQKKGGINWEEFLDLMRPVVEHDYHEEALAILAGATEEGRVAAEVERRAVNQAPPYHSSRPPSRVGSLRTSLSEGKDSCRGCVCLCAMDVISGIQVVEGVMKAISHTSPVSAASCSPSSPAPPPLQPTTTTGSE
ncbi:unnamed protein product [Choristocarpus tenellus]